MLPPRKTFQIKPTLQIKMYLSAHVQRGLYFYSILRLDLEIFHITNKDFINQTDKQTITHYLLLHIT